MWVVCDGYGCESELCVCVRYKGSVSERELWRLYGFCVYMRERQTHGC